MSYCFLISLINKIPCYLDHVNKRLKIQQNSFSKYLSFSHHIKIDKINTFSLLFFSVHCLLNTNHEFARRMCAFTKYPIHILYSLSYTAIFFLFNELHSVNEIAKRKFVCAISKYNEQEKQQLFASIVQKHFCGELDTKSQMNWFNSMLSC